MNLGAISRSSVERRPAVQMIPIDKAETRSGICLAVKCAASSDTQMCELPYPFNVHIVLRRMKHMVAEGMGAEYKHDTENGVIEDLLSLHPCKVFTTKDGAVQFSLQRALYYAVTGSNDAIWTFTPTKKTAATLHFRAPISTPTSHILGAFCLRMFKEWSTAHFVLDMCLPPLATGTLHCGKLETFYTFSCIVAL